MLLMALAVQHADASTVVGNSDMAVARAAPIAVTLADGRVLVIGGKEGFTAGSASVPGSAVAEVYDPVNNQWTGTPRMLAGRYSAAAALLPDGTVLVTGGYTGYIALASAELYDPATNNWRAAPWMSRARWGHTATTLKNGKVLVTGGRDGQETFTSGITPSAEIYDPATQTWSAAASPSVGRNHHIAVRLADGRVLVAGGFSSPFSMTASAEIYDPAINAWRSAGTMPASRAYHTAVMLRDGRVMVAGGTPYLSSSASPASAQIYDPVHNVWRSTAAPAVGRVGHAMAVLPGNRVLVIGGAGDPAANTMFASSETYFVEADRWMFSAPLAAKRAFSAFATLVNGKLLVAGGYVVDPAGRYTFDTMPARTAETFDAGDRNDCLFDWASARYAGLLGTPEAASRSAGGIIYYRAYPASHSYLGVGFADDNFYYLGPGTGQLTNLGPVSTWRTVSGCIF